MGARRRQRRVEHDRVRIAATRGNQNRFDHVCSCNMSSARTLIFVNSGQVPERWRHMAADTDCLAVTRHSISAALEARIREVTMQPPCLNVHGLLVGAGIKSNVRLRKPVVDVAQFLSVAACAGVVLVWNGLATSIPEPALRSLQDDDLFGVTARLKVPQGDLVLLDKLDELQDRAGRAQVVHSVGRIGRW
jgi:hypothetical protein